MIAWLSANWGTLLVLLVVCAVVGGILCGMRQDKKSGKSSCSCDCGSCGGCGSCAHK